MNFTKNGLAKKLIIVLVILLLFNVCYPSMSYAVDLRRNPITTRILAFIRNLYTSRLDTGFNNVYEGIHDK